MRLLAALLLAGWLFPMPARGQQLADGNRRPLLDVACRDERAAAWADSVMQRLTLKERVAQLFVYTIAPQQTKANLALLQRVVKRHKVGGLLFSGGLLENQAVLTNRAQQLADVPLLITFDGEWGLAMRLKGTPAFPKNRVLGSIRDNRLIYEYGREVARQCRELGVHVNFAPVADVNINPDNPVINVRSFGEDPRQVADKVLAYASGLEAGGVLSASKHFPGHGDTNVDSHKALPVLRFSRQRLDSVELYPFRRAVEAGLGGIMVGHLQVPALEPEEGVPSSLSRHIVQGVLKDEMGFRGLVFTDALVMKGVAAQPDLCVRALQAGIDVLLSPPDMPQGIASVVEAVKKGTLSEAEIDGKCRKVLMFKYALGAARREPVQLSGLQERIDTPEAHELIRRLSQAAVTVLSNGRNVLPMRADTARTLALVEVGEAGCADAFARGLSAHASVKRFSLPASVTEAQAAALCRSLAGYRRVVVAVCRQKLGSCRAALSRLADGSSPVLVFFTPGESMLDAKEAVAKASAVVLAHAGSEALQQRVADVLFAKTVADGRLSTSLPGLFPAGAGVTLTPQTPLRFVPLEPLATEAALRRVDSLALEGIAQGAYPGCQIVALKNGRVVIDKAYGTHAGVGSDSVRVTDLYDLASLSKTTGTLLALMKLYDQGRFSLSDRVADYLPFLRQTDKRNITIRDVLFHQSGLPAGISFYREAIDGESYEGSLFSARRDARHRVQVGRRTWANPAFGFLPEYVSSSHVPGYDWQLCEGLWLNPSFMQVVERKIVEAPMRSKVYRYSDVGFLLLRLLAERLAGLPMDEFLRREFYLPMGLERTDYRPLRRFPKSEIVPSSVDRFLRKDTLQGFVHDETAAFQGGVSGNAGLFSNAREVARIYQMLLDGGVWQGKRYLSRETCRLFSTEVSPLSRRGLGFDKPDVAHLEKSPCGEHAGASVYGHTGFTGTCAWVDPSAGLVYVFLSNRIFPDVTNMKLSQLSIREQIQDAIYEATRQGEDEIAKF